MTCSSGTRRNDRAARFGASPTPGPATATRSTRRTSDSPTAASPRSSTSWTTAPAPSSPVTPTTAETAEGAITAIRQAFTAYGAPAIVLSDNGTAFTSRLTQPGSISTFVQCLLDHSVRPINSSPYHPQTCGKVERHHQTLKKWLSTQPAPGTLTDYKHLLDTYRRYYNTQRRHSALPRPPHPRTGMDNAPHPRRTRPAPHPDRRHPAPLPRRQHRRHLRRRTPHQRRHHPRRHHRHRHPRPKPDHRLPPRRPTPRPLPPQPRPDLHQPHPNNLINNP